MLNSTHRSARVENLKTCGSDADYVEGSAVELDVAAEDFRVGPEAGPPQSLTDHHGSGSPAGVVGAEGSPRERLHPQQIEKLLRDELTGNVLGATLGSGESAAARDHSRHR